MQNGGFKIGLRYQEFLSNDKHNKYSKELWYPKE